VYFVTGGPFFADPYWPSYEALWSAPNENHRPLQTAAQIAQFFPYEIEHDPDGQGPDSNPFTLELDADGNIFVNDSGANATLMVAPDGTITTYAVYPPFPNPTDFGPPTIHQVPTGMAWGPDGALYVSTLTGFPFLDGAAVVYRLEDLDGDGDAMEEGEMEVYADGLTTSTSIAFDADGNLYATQFMGFLKGEAPNTGNLVMWDDGEWHVLVNGLSTPTGLAIGHDGDIFVSQEFFGQVLRIWHAGE
jgi:sugar lactone lactonase YvrE